MDTFSPFIERMVMSLQTKVKSEKAVNIQTAVEMSVQNILDKAHAVLPLYTVSELLLVGSYAEGTKILDPDEFDFLAIIEDLSQPGAISVNNPQEEPGLVTAAVADDKLKPKWDSVCGNGFLQCFQNSGKPSRFGNTVMTAILEMYRTLDAKEKEGASGIMASATEIDFVTFNFFMPRVNDISVKLRRAEFKTPNVLIHFELDDMPVSVDLSPAIRYRKIEDCLNKDNCASPILAEEVKKHGSLLLVGNRDYYFRVTVTETELDYMQSKMKNKHKIIYILLKYVNFTFGNMSNQIFPFTSYMLKNICLLHDLRCNNGLGTVATCFDSVIELLAETCEQKYIQSVFNVKVNLFPVPESKYEKEYRKHVIETLQDIKRHSNTFHSVKELGEFLKYHFEQFCSKTFVIEKWGQ